MIREAPENKMVRPAENKGGSPAETPKGARMCPSCGTFAFFLDTPNPQQCPTCRFRVRLSSGSLYENSGANP